jgi:hypothetical protein
VTNHRGSVRAKLFGTGAVVIALAVALSGCLSFPPDPDSYSATGPDPLPSASPGFSQQNETTSSGRWTIGDCVVMSIKVKSELVDPTVPCSEPHYSEVFGFVTVTQKDYFPGDDVLIAEAGTRCFSLFEKYVGTTINASSLSVWFYLPTEKSYLYGDNLVTCMLYKTDTSELTGSAQNSGM